ncbi:MAG: heparan-alpha-glucosaminide N-acetyltransferase domain-containing protein [Collinsella aerofaciens]
MGHVPMPCVVCPHRSIPKTIYPVPYLAWLGFPSPGFVSGDYYPIIPFIFMYLAGYFAAHIAQES